MDIEQARQLAKDETTSPEKLRELADSTDSITRQNVVMNPNVPPDVLIKLAGEFPRQVFDNPAIDLLLLETPNLFSGTSADVLCSLLKREVSNRMIEYSANATDERLKLAILMNPQTPSEIIKQLAKSKDTEISEAAKLHINFPVQNIELNKYREVVQARIQQEIDKSDRDYWTILSNIDQIIRLFENIPQCISYYMRWSISRIKNYPQITIEEVDKMIEEKKSIIDIARNPNISLEIIRKLLSRLYVKDKNIVKAIGTNPSTPVEILEELAKSERHNGVHQAVASNPKTPNSVLEILIDKPPMMGYVYEELGRSKTISINLLERLVDKHRSAFITVFNNSRTPKELKTKLLNHFEITKILPITIHYPQEFIKNTDMPGNFLHRFISYKDEYKNITPFPDVLAFHPNLLPNSLEQLLKSKNRGIRSSAVLNKNIPRYITEVWGMTFLEQFNQHELQTIADSYYITEELLKELVNHKDIRVSRTAASNPCALNEILEEWETSPSYKEGALEQIMAEEQRLLNRWKSSISAADRLKVLSNDQTTVSILTKVSRSTSWLERYAIAQNPNTPHLIIQKLTEDGNRIVRAAAKAHLETKQ